MVLYFGFVTVIMIIVKMFFFCKVQRCSLMVSSSDDSTWRCLVLSLEGSLLAAQLGGQSKTNER